MSPLDTVYGTVMVVLSGIGVLVLIGVGVDAWLTDRRNDRARRRAAAMAAHPAGREYEGSAYRTTSQFRDDLCMVTNCDQTRAHDLGNGWLVCTDCRDEIHAGWEREQLPFDQEAKQLVDEAEAFLRTEGGAA